MWAGLSEHYIAPGGGGICHCSSLRHAGVDRRQPFDAGLSGVGLGARFLCFGFFPAFIQVRSRACSTRVDFLLAVAFDKNRFACEKRVICFMLV